MNENDTIYIYVAGLYLERVYFYDLFVDGVIRGCTTYAYIDDYYSRKLTIDGIERKLNLICPGSGYLFQDDPEKPLNQAEGFMLIFDYTSMNSLEEINYMYRDICRQLHKDCIDLPFLIVGLNCEKSESERQVTHKYINDLMSEHPKWKLIDASIDQRINIEESFTKMVRMIIEYRQHPICNDPPNQQEDSDSSVCKCLTQ